MKLSDADLASLRTPAKILLQCSDREKVLAINIGLREVLKAERHSRANVICAIGLLLIEAISPDGEEPDENVTKRFIKIFNFLGDQADANCTHPALKEIRDLMEELGLKYDLH